MRQLGWYRRIRSLVPMGIRLFLFIQTLEGGIFHETLHETMAPMAWLNPSKTYTINQPVKN